MNGTHPTNGAALAALLPSVSAANGAKRGTLPNASNGKPADAANGADAIPYLVGDSLSSLSAPKPNATATSHGQRTAALILEALTRLRSKRDLSAFVLVSATLTTREGDSRSLSRAWESSRASCFGARLVPECRTDGSHEHLHGPILFESDGHAARFLSAFTSAAGGYDLACKLRGDITGFAAFVRTGQPCAAWADGGIVSELRHVCEYAYGETRRKREANLQHGDVIAHGAFAAALAAPSTEARRCVCGCGQSLDGKRSDARCFDGACRRRVGRREETVIIDLDDDPPPQKPKAALARGPRTKPKTKRSTE